MGKQRDRDQWLDDVNARQRNVVFPDTVQNEARFWRNIGTQPWTTSTKIGLALMALLVGGLVAMFVIATVQGREFWVFALLMTLICVPIFAGIAWATRRALREAHKTRNNGQR